MLQKFLGTISAYFLLLTLVSATRFLSPSMFEVWKAGSVVTIHLEGGQCNSADIQLVTNRGFLPKTIGYVAKDFKFDGEQVLKFKVWDEIESDNTYQLGFIPKLNCGPATTAYSHMFTIINDVEYRHYRFNESQEPDVKYHNDLYYFANEEEL